MKNWKDNNLSAILEYPFDYKSYIEKQLRRIDDLDQRKFAKELLIDGLYNSICSTEEKYRRLERRVYEELKIPDNRYEIATTIIKRGDYDPTNPALHPVWEEDLAEESMELMPSGEGRIPFATIYLEAGEEVQDKFRAAGRFPAKSQEAQAAEVYAEPAKRYRAAIQTLYQIFQDNHIFWETVNMGYLDKFYDIYMGGPEGGGKQPAAVEAVDFGIFGEFVRYGVIPLWNLEWKLFDSADFMSPSIDGIYYEHEFELADKEQKDGYLIQANDAILEIRHEKNRIVLKSQLETYSGWKALRLIQGETVRSLDYNAPLLTNRKRDSFFRRLASNSRIRLMTKADLFRRIMELDIRDYIEVAGYEICENVKDYPNVEGMNWFVRDELFPMETRKVLLLKFKEKQPGNYLNGSMMRFAISQMQMEIGEYRCVGLLLGPEAEAAKLEAED